MNPILLIVFGMLLCTIWVIWIGALIMVFDMVRAGVSAQNPRKVMWAMTAGTLIIGAATVIFIIKASNYKKECSNVQTPDSCVQPVSRED